MIMKNCVILVKIIGKTKSFISKKRISIKPSIFLQSEGKIWYFVTPYNMSSRYRVPIGRFRNFPKYHLFVKNWEIGKSREFFKYLYFSDIGRSIMFKYTSSPNFVQKFKFLRKLLSFFYFYKFTRTLTKIFKNRSGHLSEKSFNF